MESIAQKQILVNRALAIQEPHARRCMKLELTNVARVPRGSLATGTRAVCHTTHANQIHVMRVWRAAKKMEHLSVAIVLLE